MPTNNMCIVIIFHVTTAFFIISGLLVSTQITDTSITRCFVTNQCKGMILWQVTNNDYFDKVSVSWSCRVNNPSNSLCTEMGLNNWKSRRKNSNFVSNYFIPGCFWFPYKFPTPIKILSFTFNYFLWQNNPEQALDYLITFSSTITFHL